MLIDPSASAGSDSPTVELLTSEHGRSTVKVNNREVSWSSLRRDLNRILEKRSDKVVQVKADGLLAFSQIVHVVDICRTAGANTVLAVEVR